MSLKHEASINLIAVIDYGVKKGATLARLEHIKTGNSIFIMENEQVVEVPPENIEF